MRPIFSRSALLLALALASSCGDSDLTQILVEIDAAEDVRADATLLRLQIEARSAGGTFGIVRGDTDRPIVVDPESWPRVHVLAPLGDDVTREYRLTAQALSDVGGVVGEVRAQSGYVDGETRVLRLFIPGGECVGVTCPDDRTCRQGLCSEITPIPPEELPRRGEEGMDAGAPPTDGGGDGGEACDPESIECETENACEVARVDCSSGEPVCVVEPAEMGTECRASTGECDPAEVCDGESPFCPEDAFAELGTECAEGFCSGPVCGPCVAGEVCTDPGNPCAVGSIVCDPETGSPSCGDLGPADPGTVCRMAAGACDLPEVCEGTTCPEDAKVEAGTPCRDAVGLCDVAESCDGTSDACPADAFRGAGEECRAGSGLCDPAESCSGMGPTCPADVRLAEGAVCRPAASECDAPEVCVAGSDGAVACQDDAFAGFGTPCADGSQTCDGAGMCVDSNCGDPCDTGKPCETGVIDCSSGEPSCVPSGFRGPDVICRPAAGQCDVAEACTGTSADCPVDAFAPATTECRPAAGVCDVAESCTGTGPSCPSDAVADATVTCRERNGQCDVAERCDGSSRSCPTDRFASSTTVCRAPEGGCDVAEICTGTSPSCPDDAIRPSGYVCRAANLAGCDFVESCDGDSRSCPDDDFVPTGRDCQGRSAPYAGICVDGPRTTPHICADLVVSEVRPPYSKRAQISRPTASVPSG